MTGPIVVAVDGSTGSRAALDLVSLLMPTADLVLLTVWQPEAAALAEFGLTPEEAHEAAGTLRAGEHAGVVNTDALSVAARAGLDARGVVRAANGPVWRTLVDAADQLSAHLLALGVRGHGAMHSVLVGSVSHAVAQHARCPVLLAPTPELADARRRRPSGR